MFLCLFGGEEKSNTDKGCATYERGMTWPSGKEASGLNNSEGERTTVKRERGRENVEVIRTENKKEKMNVGRWVHSR